MKFYVRLQELLNRHELRFSNIVNETELSDFQVKHLCKSDAKEISRDVVEQVCTFLVDKRVAQRDELPALLFAASPEQFWDLLYPREQVTMCMGVRRDPTYNDQVVIAADSVLQANVLYKMTATASGQKQATALDESNNITKSDRPPQIIDPRLIDVWNRDKDDLDRDKVIESAQQCYDEFTRAKGDRALICYGSIKSNPVIECISASCFRAEPFVSCDNVSKVKSRPCPFMFAYRRTDPDPDSVCGGRKLASRRKVAKAGIHYETPEGKWLCAPWTRREDDAALVMYRFQRRTGQLEMVLGGYSGRGTRCLAEFLRDDKYDVSQIWPPAIAGHMAFGKTKERTCDIDLGVFILEFKLEPLENEADSGPSQYQKIKKATVIPLQKKVLRERVGLPA